MHKKNSKEEAKKRSQSPDQNPVKMAARSKAHAQI